MTTDDVFTVLTVCTGNICRSPLAAVALAHGLADVPGVRVVSAGTRAQDGAPMTNQGLVLARSYGLDGSEHTASYLTEGEISRAQLVLGMSREHRSAVVSMVPRAVKTTFSLREFARLAEGLSEADGALVAGLDPEDTRGRLQTMVALVASQRGQVAVASDPSDDDIVDPYRRSDDVYAESGRQLMPAASTVAEVLRSAVLSGPGSRMRPGGSA